MELPVLPLSQLNQLSRFAKIKTRSVDGPAAAILGSQFWVTHHDDPIMMRDPVSGPTSGSVPALP